MYPRYQKARKQNKKTPKPNIFLIIILLIAIVSGGIGFYLGRKTDGGQKKEAINSQEQTAAKSSASHESVVFEAGKFYFGADLADLSEEEKSKLHLPRGEVLVGFIGGDTNNDKNDEIFVIAKNLSNERGHFYIINKDGKEIPSKIKSKEALTMPDKVELRNFQDDLYPSFFLKFIEEYQEGYFIRWDGKEYKVPESDKE